MHYYSFNIGDYAKHTRHLSNLEDLAYRRLLDLYYTHEKPFNNDLKQISRLIGMRDNLDEIELVLSDFFTLEDDLWVNKRVDEEIAKYHLKSDAARANGKKGGRPKNPAKTQSVNLANPAKTGSKANQEPITNNQEPITTLKDTSSSGEDNHASKQACQYEKILNLYHSILPNHPAVRILSNSRKSAIKSRWSQDKKFQNLEFWEKLFNHVTKSDFLSGRVPPSAGRKQFIADLDFIMSPSGFVGIVEGKYDN